jgi:putative sigma-54 modulation protein
MAELILRFPGGTVQGKVSTKEMYASIDLLMEKINRQLLKHKEKRASRKRPAAGRTRGSRGPADEAAAVPAYRTIRPAVPVLDPGAALTRLGTGDAALVVFQDEATGRLQILRRLEGGAIELIDPRNG